MMLQKLKQALAQMPDLASFNIADPAHTQWLGRTHALLRQVNANDAFKFDLAAGMVGIDMHRERCYTEMRSVLELVIATLELAPDVDSRLNIRSRERFDHDVAEAVTSAQITGEPLTLVFIDLDKFKSVNDKHGHLIGDEVLESVAGLLRRVVGSKGVCYRYGGEELTVLLHNYTADEGAALAERARIEIAQASISSKQLSITACFGIAEAPGHAQTAADLIRSADQAVYQAKDLGRNLVRVSGEPVPTNSGVTPLARRRQPESGALSDRETEAIRHEYFTEGSTQCPKDGARLSISESDAHNRRTPDLLVYCPMCGLRATIKGPS